MARTLTAPPIDPSADLACLLTRERAASRRESPQHFLDLALEETPTERGVAYLLPAGDETWSRLQVFVQEEGECCPFLTFEAEEVPQGIRLNLIWPEETQS